MSRSIIPDPRLTHDGSQKHNTDGPTRPAGRFDSSCSSTDSGHCIRIDPTTKTRTGLDCLGQTKPASTLTMRASEDSDRRRHANSGDEPPPFGRAAAVGAGRPQQQHPFVHRCVERWVLEAD